MYFISNCKTIDYKRQSKPWLGVSCIMKTFDQRPPHLAKLTFYYTEYKAKHYNI